MGSVRWGLHQLLRALSEASFGVVANLLVRQG